MEMTYPTGGRGNVYIGGGFAHSRRATMNVTVATWNTEVLAVQNGTEVVTGNTELTYYDVIEANSEGKYITKFTANGTIGNEIGYVYIVGNDGAYTKVYEQSAVASEGKFAYSTATKEITFGSDGPARGDMIACAYTWRSASNAQKIVINSDAIPPVVLASAFGIAKDTCTGELFPCVIEGQAQIDGNWNFDLSSDGEPAVQNLSMEFVKGCISKELYTFTVFTEDEEVAPPEHITLSVPTGNLLGKDASDLQEGLAISETGKVTGTLKYVTDYTGFNGAQVEEQNGYYFPFKVEVPLDKGDAKATMQITGKEPVNLDLEDGTAVVFMGKDEKTARTKTLTLNIDWDGVGEYYPTEVLAFDMTDVVYQPQG